MRARWILLASLLLLFGCPPGDDDDAVTDDDDVTADDDDATGDDDDATGDDDDSTGDDDDGTGDDDDSGDDDDDDSGDDDDATGDDDDSTGDDDDSTGDDDDSTGDDDDSTGDDDDSTGDDDDSAEPCGLTLSAEVRDASGQAGTTFSPSDSLTLAGVATNNCPFDISVTTNSGCFVGGYTLTPANGTPIPPIYPFCTAVITNWNILQGTSQDGPWPYGTLPADTYTLDVMFNFGGFTASTTFTVQ